MTSTSNHNHLDRSRHNHPHDRVEESTPLINKNNQNAPHHDPSSEARPGQDGIHHYSTFQSNHPDPDRSPRHLSDPHHRGIHQLIHRIRFDLLTLIDTPLSTEQLTSPAITFSITRPLEQTYFNLQHHAIIFALLVNRVQFINDSTHALTLHSVNATRATLCEILATNVLRKIHESDLFNLSGPHSSSPSTTPSATPNYRRSHSDLGPPRRSNSSRYTVNHKLTPEEEEACLLRSANVLATAFSLFDGAPTQVISFLESDWGSRDAKNLLSRQSNALEMAIVSEAKQFIRSPACQRVIDAIWSGKIVYTSTAIVDIVSDRYKHRPVSLYNPRNAPLLNHYRLTVPRNRAALEYFHYAILIVSYVATLQTRELHRMNGFEVWYNVFTIGFAADKLGSILEHGWLVFIANLWNGFDAVFILGHFVYLALRITGLVYLSHYELKSYWLNEQSHQVLSCLAILIFPRLAFITLSDNILILSLRSMLSDFVFLMLLGAWCFLGFGYSLYSLQKGKAEIGQDSPYSLGQIAIWMVYIFFGLDATGISNAHEFHRILGPAVFIIYACLSNTLLVTVLVSILSKIFSDISNDSIAETLYRRAVLTFEGVKSDALFSFQPPFNIPAMLFLIPLKPFLTPRKFHTVVVFLCRMFGCPVLLAISFFERYVVGPFDKDTNSVGNSLKLTVANSLGGLALNHFNAITKNNLAASSIKKRTTMSKMSSRISRNMKRFGGLTVINACFDYEPYPPVRNERQAQETEDRLLILRESKDSSARTETAIETRQNEDGRQDEADTSGTLRRNIGLKPSFKHQKSKMGVKAIEGSTDLEQGTLKTATKTSGRPSVGIQEQAGNPSESLIGGFNSLRRPVERELTTLEKLFLPHTGFVSTFASPVCAPPPPIEGSTTTNRTTTMRSSSGVSDPTGSSKSEPCDSPAPSVSSKSSSTIEEERLTISRGKQTSLALEPGTPAIGGGRSTLYLDTIRTSLGGNHKPASIIQDEFEEDRLEERRRRRQESSTTNLSVVRLANSITHKSSTSIAHPGSHDHLGDLDRQDDQDPQLVLVDLNQLQTLLESLLQRTETRVINHLHSLLSTSSKSSVTPPLPHQSRPHPTHGQTPYQTDEIGIQSSVPNYPN